MVQVSALLVTCKKNKTQNNPKLSFLTLSWGGGERQESKLLISVTNNVGLIYDLPAEKHGKYFLTLEGLSHFKATWNKQWIEENSYS